MGANESDLRRAEFVERAQFGSCFIIRIPPLRERVQDVPALPPTAIGRQRSAGSRSCSVPRKLAGPQSCPVSARSAT